MPRLPTMRVMGSQDISTSGPCADSSFILPPSSFSSPPGRLLVHGRAREGAEGADGPAVDGHGGGREPGARRLVHEGHELVGESRHRATDANAADVGAAADAGHPAA